MGTETTDLDNVAPVRRLPTSGELAASVPSVRRSSMTVGAADDREEREADAVADRVVRHLSESRADSAWGADSGSGTTARRSPAPSGGDVEVGAAGGPISDDLARSINSRPTAPLPEGVRRQMESGFGQDLSHVRMVTDSPDAAKMQARAFTLGNDIHFGPGQFRPGSADGNHTIAHEISHAVQSSGGLHRRMFNREEFNQLTYQGRLTRKSTAQKELGPLLDAFHTAYPADTMANLDAAKAEAARKEVAVMKVVASKYVDSKTTVYTAADGPGENVVKGSRAKRVAGMAYFMHRCDQEMQVLDDRLTALRQQQGNNDPLEAVDVSGDERVQRITAHYTGDAGSSFRKLGNLIDMAVPVDGDAASLSIEVNIPVQPGVFVTLGFAVDAERDGDSVSCGLNVTAGASGKVGNAAEIAGELGGYLKASAKTGADVAELWSYALFRRCRESPAIPREVANFMWGGDGGKFGWQKAETWSQDVERNILAQQDDSFVESGGLAKLKGKVGFDQIAALEASATGFVGTRIDAKSLDVRKGGAGNKNKMSDNIFNRVRGVAGGSLANRGAQKRVGVTRAGFAVNVAAGNDFVGGGVGVSMGWRSNGAHGKKTYQIDNFELTGEFTFTMPAGELVAGGLVNMVPPLITTINTAIARGKERAAAQDADAPRNVGAVGAGLDSFASAFAGLGMSTKDWTPPATMDDTPLSGFSAKTTYKLGVSGKLTPGKQKELSITLSQDKTSEVGKAADAFGEAAQVFKLSMSKTSRILSITHKGQKIPVFDDAGTQTGEDGDPTGWYFSWAGGSLGPSVPPGGGGNP